MTTQPCYDYECTKKLARDVRKEANRKAGKKKYTARPRIPWKKPSEFYWLIPSTELPVHSYGKAFFKFEKKRYKSSNFFIGLHVNRGLSQKGVEEALGAKESPILEEDEENWIQYRLLKEDWIWHRFNEGLKGQLIEATLKGMLDALEIPLNIYLEVKSLTEPDCWHNKPWLETQSNPRFEIVKTIKGVKLRKRKEEKTSKRVWTYLRKNPTLQELANYIEKRMHTDLYWIDFYIGTMLPLCTDISSPVEPWNAADIWNKILSPWKSWFKKEP